MINNIDLTNLSYQKFKDHRYFLDIIVIATRNTPLELTNIVVYLWRGQLDF